jgi:hypothetical protein
MRRAKKQNVMLQQKSSGLEEYSTKSEKPVVRSRFMQSIAPKPSEEDDFDDGEAWAHHYDSESTLFSV